MKDLLEKSHSMVLSLLCLYVLIVGCALGQATVQEKETADVKQEEPRMSLDVAGELFSKGLEHHRKGEYEKAIKFFKRIAAGRPESPTHYYMSMYNIACAYSLMGKKKEAFEWLRKSMEGKKWNTYWVLKDPDFKPLHGEKEWEQITKEARDQGTGPRFTEDEMFSHLKPDYPGLENVHAALEKGDREKAKVALAQYFRTRGKPKWELTWGELPEAGNEQAKKIIERAEQVMAHYLDFYKGIPHQFGEEIDWRYNPTTQEGSKYAMDHEWTWVLNRHAMWRDLAQAYLVSGDEKYAAEFARQMTGWVKRCPVPVEMPWNNPHSCWRTIESGIRMGMWGWPNILYAFLKSPSFTDEALLLMVRSMIDHGRYLRKFHRRGNWLTMEMCGLYHVAVLLQEFKESDEWREFAISKLHEEMRDVQVYPDGWQFELTPGYHNVSLKNFAGPVPLSELNGVALPEGYKALLERMYDVNLYSMMPDGYLPGFNDSGIYKAAAVLEKGLEFFPQREDWRWVATGGEDGRVPEKLSHAFEYAGYLIMRNGWDREARYLAFDVGPFGAGHQHEDKLNFIMSAYGARMVVEAGLYFYDDSKWRRYVLSARGHNVIHIDGLEQHRRGVRKTYTVKEPVPHLWKTMEEYDYAQGYYGGELEGFGPERRHIAQHTRRILFVRGAAWGGDDYWIVIDTLKPIDEEVHKYESTFHIDMKKVQADSQTHVVTAANEDGPGLIIWPVAGSKLETKVISGQEEPVQGWMPNYPKTGCRELPTVCYTQEAKGPALFAYIFYPLRKGARLPVKDFQRIPFRARRLDHERTWTFCTDFGKLGKHILTVSESESGIPGMATKTSVTLTLTDTRGKSHLYEVVK